MVDSKYVYIFGGFALGLMVGMLFVYKVEINTINQALDSLHYCYETYLGGKG